MLSTNVALNGQTFVSSLEGRGGLPVFGVQFHPESNQWDPGELQGGELVPARSLPAIQSVQYLANFFVELARNNTHRYPTGLEESEDRGARNAGDGARWRGDLSGRQLPLLKDEVESTHHGEGGCSPSV